MSLIPIILVLLSTVLATSALARRLPLPLPLLLIAAGTGLGFVPGFDAVAPEPGTFFLLFIPLLLFADAWMMPKREFMRLRYPILGLALGLVLVTVLVLGYVVHWLVPAVPLAAGFALAAVVSPTDAVAVGAITERLRLPGRLTHILAGESLINDASGLVAFKFAVAAVLTGGFSWAAAGTSFVLLAGGGALAGLTVAWAVQALRLGLSRHGLTDAAISTGLSLLTPYAAYLAAEHFHLSGVLAAVAAGWYAGVDDGRHTTAEVRLVALNVWYMLVTLFNGLVFVLLGLQLPAVMAGIADRPWPQLAGQALAVTGVLVALRLLWVFPASRVALWLSRLHDSAAPAPSWQQVLVAGWAAPRGAVTLAGALSLPLLAGDAPFPERDLLIFLAGAVILLTLTLNALTLPGLIRWLDLHDDGTQARETRAARVATAQAAIAGLRAALDLQSVAHELRYTHTLIDRYERRIRRHCDTAPEEAAALVPELVAEARIRLLALDAERRELQRLRDRRLINDAVLRTLQRDLDIIEAGLDATKAAAV